MLTRLKISGFKNLVDADIHFGTFTCIAGANGVGKSNLFDAIRFLGALADDTLINAAAIVRNEGRGNADVRSLFHRVGEKCAKEISFEAEMIIPAQGTDDLGQRAEAAATFVRYAVTLACRTGKRSSSLGPLELIRERLEPICSEEASEHLKFPHDADAWRRAVLKGRRTSPLISTEHHDGNRVIISGRDRGRGSSGPVLAANLPRTLVSAANTTENPDVLMARREMQSWRLFRLEPASLREPDHLMTRPYLGHDGSHLAATLHDMACSQETGDAGPLVCDQMAARLCELTGDVRDVRVDRDEARDLLTLQVTGRDGTVHPARSLSDGMLRFAALALLELSPTRSGLICMEEPENGIHPERIPAMIRLLEDIAADPDLPEGPDNPMRQVIVSTHSPAVVSQVSDESLLIAESEEMVRDGRRFRRVCFNWLPDTWRASAFPHQSPVARGRLLAYLNPVMPAEEHRMSESGKSRRVADRDDLQMKDEGMKDESNEG